MDDMESKAESKESNNNRPVSPQRRRASLAGGLAATLTATATGHLSPPFSVTQHTRKMSLPESPSHRSPPMSSTSSNHASHPPRSASRMTARRDSTTSHQKLRKTPSTISVRDEYGMRRTSAGTSPSLDKRISMGSARSSANGDDTTHRKQTTTTSSSNTSASASTSTPPSRSSNILPNLPPPASMIATEHFSKEMAMHQAMDLHANTLVILHDSCYAHRFARPNTPRSHLDAIVERPERLQACALGIAAAYVLLGERSSAGRYPPAQGIDVLKLPTPPFQICKSARTVPLSAPAVTHVHGTKWTTELAAMCQASESRLAQDGKELERPPSSDGSDSKKPLHTGDLYLCPGTLDALQGALGGICEGVDAIFTPGPTRRAFVAVRPPGHHCASDHPAGFCWVNNVHVGIAHAALQHGLTHAAIIDFDLHHGDGSQALAWEQNVRANASGAARNAGPMRRTRVGYFSLHDVDSYPCEDGSGEKVRDASVCIEGAHGQFVHNVHMCPWETEEEFWAIYEDKYRVILDKARDFLRLHTQRLKESSTAVPPKAAIFVSAGFDASEFEGAGMQRHGVNVPTSFYARFTADIVRLAEEDGLGVEGRVLSVLEGGYSERALVSGTLSHISGMTARPFQVFENENECESEAVAGDELTAEMEKMTLSDDKEPFTYHPEWWSPPCLEQLETAVHGPSKKPPLIKRQKSPPTYSSPTQASVAKAVVPPKDVKPAVRTWLIVGDTSPQEVDWPTAARELRGILIPADRETRSLGYEELRREQGGEKEGKKGGVPTEGHAMRLRARKPKTSVDVTAAAPATARPKTITRVSSRASLPAAAAKQNPHTAADDKAAALPPRATSRMSTTRTPASQPLPDLAPGSPDLRSRSTSQPPRVKPMPSSEGQGDVPPLPTLPPSGSRRSSQTVSSASTTTTSTSNGRLSREAGRPGSRIGSAGGGGGRRAQSLTGKEKEKENDAPASASASGALSTANVDQLANGVRRLHLKLNGPKPIPEEGNNGGAARVGTARTATAAAPTLRGRKSVPHLSAQRSSVLDSRRAPASKRTSASVSASHASNDRLPDPHSPGFSSPFQHSVTSEAVSEPPKSPPSISASASVSMGSEASLRTVEGFPRDEIPKEMLAPYEVQQLRSGSEAQNVGLASLGSFATVKGEVNRD